MNVPNFLTAIRFILIPVFGYYLITEQYTASVILFLLGGVTDVLDGFIARKFNMVTAWGKFADPLADKLTQITALVLLAVLKKIPFVILVVIALKELLMGIGSISIYKNKKYIVTSSWYGKMATVIFYISVAIIIVWDLESIYNGILIGIAVIAALFAFFMYLGTYIKIRKNSN